MTVFVTNHSGLNHFLNLSLCEQEELFYLCVEAPFSITYPKFGCMVDKYVSCSIEGDITVIEFYCNPSYISAGKLNFEFDEDLENLSFNTFKKQLIYQTV